MTQEDIYKQVADELNTEFKPEPKPEPKIRLLTPDSSLLDKWGRFEKIGKDLIEQVEIAGQAIEEKHRRDLLDLQLVYEKRIEAYLREQKRIHEEHIRNLDEDTQRKRYEHQLLISRMK